MVDRRNFLAAAAAAAMGSAEAAPQLAVSGGTAVRSKPLGGPNWGPQYYDGKEQRQLEEVLESRNPFRFSNPLNRSKVALFENECAARMQTKHALAVTSGTAALHVAMAALEVGPGDEVILPAWTWYSCYSTVIQAGALPVFAEIDESFNIDPKAIEPLITPQTKVIMAVHLQGTPAYMDPILAIARKHGLKVLEDASQSVGASYQGKPLGSMGDIGIYSLQQSKTITAGGRGLAGDQRSISVRTSLPVPRRDRAQGLSHQAGFHPGAELPDERIHRRRAAGAIAQAGHDHRRCAAQRAARVWRDSRFGVFALAPPAGSRRRTRHRHLPGIPHQGRAPALRGRDDGRGCTGILAGGLGDSAHRAGDRTEGDGDAAMAELQFRAGEIHPLRPRVLPAHHRHSEPLCRRDDESQVHGARHRRCHRGGAQSVPGNRPGVGAGAL